MKNSFLARSWAACVSVLRGKTSERIAFQEALASSMALQQVLQSPMQQLGIKAIAPLILGFFVTVQNAHAFGMGDVLSMGVNLGSKVVGAAVGAGVDKVKDAMRDPEAEAAKKKAEDQKVADKYQQALAEIESHREWSPLQRERGVMGVKKAFASVQQMQQFVQAAEASQKAQRDQIFTPSGLMGAVGQAALSTPSMAMAQADIMSKSPTMRSQINSSLQQADLQVAAGIPQAQAKAAIALTDSVVDGISKVALAGQLPSAVGSVNADAMSTQKLPGDAANTPPPDASALVSSAKTESTNAFSADLGKKIYLEFVGSARQTKALRDVLQARGHSVTERKNEAEISYLVEGEYVIAENKEHKGLNVSVAQLLDDPNKPMEKPDTKASGMVSAGFGKLVSVMAQAQGVNIPKAAASSGYRQQLLLVAARQPKDGAESRFAVFKEVDSSSLEGVALAKNANAEMLDRLGVLVTNSAQ